MAIEVPNRPFSSELFTGLALPGGFFVPMLGEQAINAHFVSDAPLTNIRIYVESVSDPNISVVPQTYSVRGLNVGAYHLLQWKADFSRATLGTHRISFIVQSGTRRVRILKKIFVLGITNDASQGVYRAEYPEGVMQVRFKEVITPEQSCCGKGQHSGRVLDPKSNEQLFQDVSDQLVKIFENSGISPCLAIALLSKVEVSITPLPSYAGQFSDLPFQDPTTKEVLTAVFTVLIFLALLIAFIVGVVVSGVVIVGTAGAGAPVGGAGIVAITACCNPVQAVAIAIAVGAAAGAAITGAADFPDDPFRRGQANTLPGTGEITIAEKLNLELSYPEPIIPGTPYKVGAKWIYTRETQNPSGGTFTSYNYVVDEIRQNTHVLSRYEIEHPDVVRYYKQEPFIVNGRFFSAEGKILTGNQLFVQCFLEGTGSLQGRYYRFLMQDSGIFPDKSSSDGTYTGIFYFRDQDLGQWHVTVVAQDVNLAREDMPPEEAATYLGSQILTHQLTLTTTGGTCPFTPDGDVRVI